ncbi:MULTISPECIES: fluoride efflux transporter FluC [Bifidobacterium]|uniref:fluoride efflux transporter FluC n=1 Tax=Bifidobacterium TaxID=1678 RepID=UPI0018DBB359|nr:MULTISPECIES: CrcB family protein [Bifidobacterium]MBI0145338.1 CrcB family protein [Bifidobacterium polysaccharolyticum]MBI0152160.1 CrcB family protein [Bifidobacterium sp. M0399]
MTIAFTLLICLCGGLGAGLRYLLDTLVKARWQVDLPLSTMIINLLAGLAAGLVTALAAFHGLPAWGRLLLATGLLGGFSTFSTAVNEVLALTRQRRHLAALGYLAASMLLPPLLTALGFLLAGPGM